MSPRRASKSLIEELAEVFEHLPWPAGVIVAMVATGIGFLLPHLPSMGPLQGLYAVLGQWFLWLLAGAILLYTGGGVIRRWNLRRRFDATAQVATLDPYEFEGYVEEFYRRKGYLLTPRGGRRPDGGVDLVAESRDERLIIQCKHWKAWQVGVKPVRELWGLVDHEKATGAVLVTGGSFTREATSFARGKRLDLIDGEALRRLVGEVKSAPRTTEPAASPTADPTRSCPSCGSAMVLRTARRGTNSGHTFWGCSRYPGCRGVIPSLTG
jgi:restriction system protein